MPTTVDEIDQFVLDFTTEDVGIGGTHRIGTLRASREEITRQFGEPDTGYPKSTYHWQIRFPDGSVVTIYDYRERNRFADADETREWSIGGRDTGNAELLSFLGFDVETF